MSSCLTRASEHELVLRLPLSLAHAIQLGKRKWQPWEMHASLQSPPGRSARRRNLSLVLPEHEDDYHEFSISHEGSCKSNPNQHQQHCLEFVARSRYNLKLSFQVCCNLQLSSCLSALITIETKRVFCVPHPRFLHALGSFNFYSGAAHAIRLPKLTSTLNQSTFVLHIMLID